eukprot:scaffold137646_cov28-Tisochrysis_lutea.AAC.3
MPAPSADVTNPLTSGRWYACTDGASIQRAQILSEPEHANLAAGDAADSGEWGIRSNVIGKSLMLHTLHAALQPLPAAARFALAPRALTLVSPPPL